MEVPFHEFLHMGINTPVQFIKYNHACIWTFDRSGTSVIQHKENNHY